jgi:para-nitrobenzyl esterase
VWAPSDAHNAPVFLWIHGGAFVFGSGNDAFYDGTHLAETFGVIVVTINYRLGALGFLAHPALDAEDPSYPTSGNYGIEDQFAAIQWVHDNISAFGGDPAKVTLAGESAGGYSVCIHYLAERTQGLFANAISESGLCTGFELPSDRARVLGQRTAMKVGCTTGDIAACLRSKTSDDFLTAAADPIGMQAPGGPIYEDGPPELAFPNADGVVLASSITDGFEAQQFAPRPLLLGTNKDEGTLFHSTIFANPVTDETEYRAALSHRFAASDIDAIVSHYPVGSDANAAIAAVSGDAFFVCPARRTARQAAMKSPVFRYSFEQPLFNPLLPDAGVIHSAELPFVFGNDNAPTGMIGDAGQPVATAMQAYWQSFVAQGQPAGDVAWPMYVPANDDYLTIATPVAANAGLKTALCDFWDTITPLPP